MLKKIIENVWKFDSTGWGGNFYVLKIYDNKLGKDIWMLIDTSDSGNKESLLKGLEELGLKVEDVDVVLMTHWHPDHSGNLNLFENGCEIFISEKEIEFYKLEKFKFGKLEEVGDRWKGMKFLYTPGHTIGSYCFLLNGKVLFSGDTLFFNDGRGRTDFPSGDEEMIMESLEKLKGVDYDILCPGHDY